MFSSDNHIHKDIKNLLSRDLSNEKIEKIVSILGSQKPKITIDRTFQKNLKENLSKQKIRKSPFLISSFFSFQNFSFVSVVCASFLMVLTFWNLFFPKSTDIVKKMIPTTSEDIPLSYISLSGSTSSGIVSKDSGLGESIDPDNKITKKDPVDTEIEGILSDLSAMSIDNTTNKSTSITQNTPTETLSKSTTRMSVENFTIPSYSSMTTSNQDTGNISDANIDDDFDSVVADYSKKQNSASGIVLPDYPEQIPVYQKTGVFTPDEVATHRGQNIMTVMMHAEKDTDMLRDELIKKAGGKRMKKDGKLIYEVQNKDNGTSFLVPKIQFSLVAGKPISVSVVSGME